jgi:hypothetical protein
MNKDHFQSPKNGLLNEVLSTPSRIHIVEYHDLVKEDF